MRFVENSINISGLNSWCANCFVFVGYDKQLSRSISLKKHNRAACALAIALTLAGGANAGIIFEENFDAENGGTGVLNYNGFANWNVSNGTVDLIGNGYFDFLPGNGLYVDMDGSTNDAGLMMHLEPLAVGDYTLSFDLAGNQRNSAVEFTTANVSILVGSGVSANQSYSLVQNIGFTTYSLDFSVTDDFSGSGLTGISFGAAGGDNIGMLLDNVVLATKVPEPASVVLLGLGLIGLGAARRRTS